MLGKRFVQHYVSIKHQQNNILGILVPFICKFLLQIVICKLVFTHFVYNCRLKVEAEQYLTIVVLFELMDSDDEKPTRDEKPVEVKKYKC